MNSVITRPAQTLDLTGVLTCEIRTHEIPLSDDAMRELLKDCICHLATQGKSVTAYLAFLPGDKFEIKRVGCPDAETFDRVLQDAFKVHCWNPKEILIELNELDVTYGYRWLAERLKFEKATGSSIQAYGQTWSNYLYSMTWPL